MPSRHRSAYGAAARGGLIALGLLVAPAAFGSPQITANDPEPTAGHHGGAQNAAPRPAPPIVIQVKPSPKEVRAVAQQDAAERRILWLEPDAWVAIFTGVLSLSTGLLWFDTRKSANAALKAANVAESALVDLERPYVYVDVLRTGMDVLRSGFTPRGGKFEETGRHLDLGALELAFFNFGRTPANLKRLEIVVVAAPHGSIPDAIDQTLVGGRPLPIGVVSDQTRPYKETRNLFAQFSMEDRDEIANGRKSAWIMGFVRYEDIFKRPHITGFTLVVDLTAGPPSVAVFRGDERYNYAGTEEEHDMPPPSNG